MSNKLVSSCQLYTKPLLQAFDARQEGELIHCLETSDDDLSLFPIGRPEELKIDVTGRTLEGYRYTSLGFRHLARILAKGLVQVIPDMVGLTPRSDADGDSLTDVSATVDFFNAVVDARFPLLRRFRLVRNDAEQLIEGLVSNDHRFLENRDFYSCVRDAMGMLAPQPRFYSAVVIGRKLSVWFRETASAFTSYIDDSIPFPVYRGYYFCNGEIKGTSVRGTPALFTRAGVCLVPYKSGKARLPHKGRDFHKRLAEMFANVTSLALPVEQLQAGLAKLAATPLEISSSHKVRAAQEKRMAIMLHHLGVDGRLAMEAVVAAIDVGHPEFIGKELWKADIRHRTLFDIFVSLLRMSRRLDSNRREQLEQAAYSMLAGKFLSLERKAEHGTNVTVRTESPTPTAAS